MSAIAYVKLQVQNAAGNWNEVGRCASAPQIIAKRLDELKGRYKRTVRAVDMMDRVVDLR